MPHIRRQFERDHIYHIVTHRMGNALLFKDIDDYYRGVFSIYEFNNAKPVSIRERRKERARFKKQKPSKGSPLMVEPDKREHIVEILQFCLMPNHIHLLLREIKDNGISQFMLKFGSGYSDYFKQKYEERGKGHFFQDRFVAVPIETNEQLDHVFVYIHTNPISLVEPGWKERGIENSAKVIDFIEHYKWSSYQDYLGKKNFPSVTERKWLLEVMGGPDGCRKSVNDWVKYKKEFRDMIKGIDKTIVNQRAAL